MIYARTQVAHTLSLRDWKDMEGAEARVFPVEVLREFSTRVFIHVKVSEKDAAEAADAGVCRPARHRFARRRSAAYLFRTPQRRTNQSRFADYV
jgi:hypothetical protein